MFLCLFKQIITNSTSLFVEILTLIYNTHRDLAKNVSMHIMLTPYIFLDKMLLTNDTYTLSVLVIQLRHGLIISCPPPQDIPYYRMSMLREITFLQITYHSVSISLLIMQLNVCVILVVTIITKKCPPLTIIAPHLYRCSLSTESLI